MSVNIDLSGAIALVTGGSSGIGAAAVRSLHEAGASVFFTFFSRAERAAALAAQLGERAAFTRCELGDAESLPSVVEQCVDRFGGIDIVVNNAAVFAENPFEGEDYASWRRGWQKTFDANLFGAANIAWLAMHRMRRQGRGGRIINVASRAGHRGELTFADYGASKAALINLTKSIARACAKDGITAVAVAPGWVETDMAAPDLAIPARRRQIEAEIPLGRVGDPQDIANVITFLASPLAAYANGATIDLNGGSYVR